MKLTLPLIACIAISAATGMAQQNPPQWDSTTTFTAGGIVRGSDGNFYKSIHDSLNHDPTKDPHAYWELYYARTAMVLKIDKSGQRFSSLTEAWAFIQSAYIPTSANIMLEIVPATTYLENMGSSFSLNHSCGAQIQIGGTDASKIGLRFPAGSNGFTLSLGHSFGGISGVTIDGTSPSGVGSGLVASGQASLHYSKLVVKNFSVGVFADKNSSIEMDKSNISKFTSRGIYAEEHSFISAQGASVDGGSAGYVGILSADGSNVQASYAQVENVIGFGFRAQLGSSMLALGAIALNTNRGYQADTHSTIYADGSSSKNNQIGYFASAMSYISALSTANMGNAQDFSPAGNVSSPDLGFVQH